jgi:hypothetical protein
VFALIRGSEINLDLKKIKEEEEERNEKKGTTR